MCAALVVVGDNACFTALRASPTLMHIVIHKPVARPKHPALLDPVVASTVGGLPIHPPPRASLGKCHTASYPLTCTCVTKVPSQKHSRLVKKGEMPLSMTTSLSETCSSPYTQ